MFTESEAPKSSLFLSKAVGLFWSLELPSGASHCRGGPATGEAVQGGPLAALRFSVLFILYMCFCLFHVYIYI